MDITKEAMSFVVKKGCVELVIEFAVMQQYPITAEEIVNTIEKNPSVKLSTRKVFNLVRGLKPPLKVLEELIVGFQHAGYIEIATKIAKFHTNPQSFYESIVMDVVRRPDSIEETFVAVKLVVSEDAYRTYLNECIKYGKFELAEKTARLRKIILTEEEYEQMIRVNLENYSSLEAAEKAATRVGRKLTRGELDYCVRETIKDYSFPEALSLVRELGRPFTTDELKTFVEFEQRREKF